MAAPASNGSAGEPAHGARVHSKSEEASSARSHNHSRVSDARKPAKTPGSGKGDKAGGSSRGSGSGGGSGKVRAVGSAIKGSTRQSNGAGGGGSGRKDKEVSFNSAQRTATPHAQTSHAPPVVTPQQLPDLLAKLKSTAAPEVGAAVKGLWGLVCAGHLQV